MAKIRKSISKRFKFTKTGKVLRRAVGLDHNLAKKTGNQKRKNKKWVLVGKSEAKVIKKLLKY
ncbi:MAG: 50S ribosomal protein L35 [Patescibacteria group bacterium]|nr:50S ribosomal protein L35 [Patescibacteria group bacterium]MBU1877291.1 50S ribosomal protein L35 [Patescibacteria group bacterium]